MKLGVRVVSSILSVLFALEMLEIIAREEARCAVVKDPIVFSAFLAPLVLTSGPMVFTSLAERLDFNAERSSPQAVSDYIYMFSSLCGRFAGCAYDPDHTECADDVSYTSPNAWFRWWVITVLVLLAVIEAARALLVLMAYVSSDPSRISQARADILGKSPFSPLLYWRHNSWFYSRIVLRDFNVTFWDHLINIMVEAVSGSMLQLALELWFFFSILNIGLSVRGVLAMLLTCCIVLGQLAELCLSGTRALMRNQRHSSSPLDPMQEVLLQNIPGDIRHDVDLVLN
jgi:hypothetical protein